MKSTVRQHFNIRLAPKILEWVKREAQRRTQKRGVGVSASRVIEEALMREMEGR